MKYYGLNYKKKHPYKNGQHKNCSLCLNIADKKLKATTRRKAKKDMWREFLESLDKDTKV